MERERGRERDRERERERGGEEREGGWYASIVSFSLALLP